MSVNPPEPENFGEDTVVTETVQTTPEHPNTVYLQDLQAVQLEVYRANVEKRDPDFSSFNPNSVRAAGYDPETNRPIGQIVDDEGNDVTAYNTQPATLTNDAIQTEIKNASGVLNERPEVPAYEGDPAIDAPSEGDVLLNKATLTNQGVEKYADDPEVQEAVEHLREEGVLKAPESEDVESEDENKDEVETPIPSLETLLGNKSGE